MSAQVTLELGQRSRLVFCSSAIAVPYRETFRDRLVSKRSVHLNKPGTSLLQDSFVERGNRLLCPLLFHASLAHTHLLDRMVIL